MRKSAIAIVLSLVFAVMCIAPFIYAGAADSKPFSLKQVKMENGVLRLSINAHDMSNLVACDFKLNYDSSIFTPKANNAGEYWVIGADSKAAQSISGDFYAEVNQSKCPMPVSLYFKNSIATQKEYNTAKLDVDVADFELIVLSFSYNKNFDTARFTLKCDYNYANSDDTLSMTTSLTVNETVVTTAKAPEVTTRGPEVTTNVPVVPDELSITAGKEIKLVDNKTTVVISDTVTPDSLVKAAHKDAVILNADNSPASGKALASGMKIAIMDGEEIIDSKTIVLIGDIDGDSAVSSADARIALRSSVNLEVLKGWQLVAADAECNNQISAADARLILRASVNLEKVTDWLAAL